MRGQLKYKSVDEYLSFQPEDIQYRLEDLRGAIRRAAPKATEMISYNIPAYWLGGVLVYFAAYKNHIGFYPTSSGVREFKAELSKYKVSKGAIQFPIDEALPLGLITKIVKFRVKENMEKTKIKGKVEGPTKNR
jgi:uncharacterized protein YdhG (YjbR/CyaY superfamily)